MIVCVVVSDRGDLYLPDCLTSRDTFLLGDYETVLVDDSAHALGMAGAVRDGWKRALDLGADFIFHLEEDFLFTQPVWLEEMRHVLERCPHLAQVVLKRQPWNDEEQRAGGIVECAPGDFTECRAMGRSVNWTEHSRIFSLNPCLIPRRVAEMGWPDGNEAEFTQMCVDAGYRFAFLGGKFDPPRVEHVGHHRANGWRL